MKRRTSKSLERRITVMITNRPKITIQRVTIKLIVICLHLGLSALAIAFVIWSIRLLMGTIR